MDASPTMMTASPTQAPSEPSQTLSQTSQDLAASTTQTSLDTPASFTDLLRARVKLAGSGTFAGPNYDCRVMPSGIPFHVELRYDFHDIKRTIFVLWCADTKGNPVFLSVEQKDRAYALIMKKPKTEDLGVKGILKKLKEKFDRPEAVLRSMAEAINKRDVQKQNDAVDSLSNRINQMIQSTGTGRFVDITLEQAKVVAKGVMDGHILISSLNQYRPTELADYEQVEVVTEQVKAVNEQVETVSKPVEPPVTKEEEGIQQPGKNAKRNAKRNAARKAKRDAQKVAGHDFAEGTGKSRGITEAIEKGQDTAEGIEKDQDTAKGVEKDQDITEAVENLNIVEAVEHEKGIAKGIEKDESAVDEET